MGKVVNIIRGIPNEYDIGIKTNKSSIRTTSGNLEFKNYSGIWRQFTQFVVYNTVAEAEASMGYALVPMFVIETHTLYEFNASASGNVRNGTTVLNAANGVDARYLAVSGQYSLYATGSGGHIEETYRVQLNATDLTNKYIELMHIPFDANDVVVFVEKGIIGAYQEDYNVSSNRIVWDGLSWDGVLAIGDTLRVIYWHV